MDDGHCKTEFPPCPQRRYELTGVRYIRWGSCKSCTVCLLPI